MALACLTLGTGVHALQQAAGGHVLPRRTAASELSTAGLTPGQIGNAANGAPPTTPGPTGSSGSLDRPPCFFADATNRNPGAINPRVYICDPPIIGSFQDHTVYFGPKGRYTMAIIRAHAWGTSQLLPGGQNLLVAPASPKYFQLGPLTGPVSATTRIRVPADSSLCGYSLTAQAYLWDPTGVWPFVLSNAMDMFVGDS